MDEGKKNIYMVKRNDCAWLPNLPIPFPSSSVIATTPNAASSIQFCSAAEQTGRVYNIVKCRFHENIFLSFRMCMGRRNRQRGREREMREERRTKVDELWIESAQAFINVYWCRRHCTRFLIRLLTFLLQSCCAVHMQQLRTFDTFRAIFHK